MIDDIYGLRIGRWVFVDSVKVTKYFTSKEVMLERVWKNQVKVLEDELRRCKKEQKKLEVQVYALTKMNENLEADLESK